MIVPDVLDQYTKKRQVDPWEASDPKEYKIRVLDLKHMLLIATFLGTDTTRADLDNHRTKMPLAPSVEASLTFCLCLVHYLKVISGHQTASAPSPPLGSSNCIHLPTLIIISTSSSFS